MKRDLTYFLQYTKPENDCLIWTRCFNTDGYPRCAWKGSVNGKVHRIVWELHNKQDPTGYVVRHTCDNPKCINPNHLLLGTNLENIQDRVQRDRTQGLKQNDVLAIQYMYHNKIYTMKELATLFNVSYNTIQYSIKYRKVGT
jgi:hypothetical protein